MLASDLLGLSVRTPSGEALGIVLDVRLVQDGPLLGGFAAMRISGFVIGRHRLAARLGYDRARERGPWLLRTVVRAMTSDSTWLPWEQAVLERGALVAQADLEAVPTLTA